LVDAAARVRKDGGTSLRDGEREAAASTEEEAGTDLDQQEVEDDDEFWEDPDNPVEDEEDQEDRQLDAIGLRDGEDDFDGGDDLHDATVPVPLEQVPIQFTLMSCL